MSIRELTGYDKKAQSSSAQSLQMLVVGRFQLSEYLKNNW